ncbi:MAG: DUF4115 domain-containing protein [Mycobacteriales bacterium]
MGRHSMTKGAIGSGRHPSLRNFSGGEHPAISLVLSTGAAILVTAVVFGSTSFADRGTEKADRSGASSPAATAPAATKSAPATVELRWTKGNSWVRVTDAKGKVLINDIYPAGTVKQFTGPRFTVEIGNPGAVTVLDKGQPQKLVGKPGSVTRSTITGP